MIRNLCFAILCVSGNAAAEDSPRALDPHDAAKSAIVPPGFRVKLFAAEPIEHQLVV